MKRLLLYPFETDMLPFVLHICRHPNSYELAAVCAENSTGLVGKDVGFSWNLEDIGIQVMNDPVKYLDSCDAVCILPHKNLDITNLVKSASALGKEILDYGDMPCEGTSLTSEQKILGEFEKLGAKAMLDFETPIIEVGGLIETSDKDQITLSLMDGLRGEGLSVSVFSDHDFIRFAGGHNFQSIYENDFSASAMSLNHFIRAIELYEKPDVMIVQVPGNLFRHDNKLIGDLGISAFLFSQIFVPDYFIASVMLGTYPIEFWDSIRGSLKSRFGLSLDAVHISNKTMIPDLSEEEGRMSFYQNAICNVRTAVDANRKCAPFPVGNLFEANDLKEIIQDIFKKMTATEGDA